MTANAVTTRVLTLLPTCNTHVDPDQPNASLGSGLMVVSSAGNVPKRVAFVRFDLAVLPTDATVTACKLELGISGDGAKQVVEVNFVADNTWTEQVTYANKPAASTPIGTWLVESSGTVATSDDNPALVRQVITQRTGSGTAISMQLCSTFGEEGAQVSNAYHTFETAAASNDPGSAPRLVIEYEPAAAPIHRGWPQFQCDPRHSGATPWRGATTPTTTYTLSTLVSGAVLTSPIVAVGGLIYSFAAAGLQVLDPRTRQTNTLRTLTDDFATLAATDVHFLVAASKTQVIVFDLARRGDPVRNTTLTVDSEITPGPDGQVYLRQGTKLLALVVRDGEFATSWSFDLQSTTASPVSLSPDASVVYVATPARLLALDAADGSPVWRYDFQRQASRVSAPVCSTASGVTWLTIDDSVVAVGSNGVARRTYTLTAGVPMSQPVIGSDDGVTIVQGAKVAVLPAAGSSDPTVTKTVAGLAAKAALYPVLDGDGNLYLIDHTPTLLVLDPTLATVASVPVTGAPRSSSLVLGSDGTVFWSSQSAIYALTPGVPDAVRASQFANATAYRGAKTVTVGAGTVPATASVLFQAGTSIAVEPGFSIPVGATAAFVTGG